MRGSGIAIDVLFGRVREWHGEFLHPCQSAAGRLRVGASYLPGPLGWLPLQRRFFQQFRPPLFVGSSGLLIAVLVIPYHSAHALEVRASPASPHLPRADLVQRPAHLFRR